MKNQEWKTEDPPKDRVIQVQYSERSYTKSGYYALNWGFPMNVYWNNDKQCWMNKDVPIWNGSFYDPHKKPNRWKEIE